MQCGEGGGGGGNDPTSIIHVPKLGDFDHSIKAFTVPYPNQ